MAEPSISERLRLLGIGHRRTDRSFLDHELFRIETGEILGDFDAQQAVIRFLSSE